MIRSRFTNPSPNPLSAQLKVQVQKPATGACPSGYALTEAECAGLDGKTIDGKSVKYIKAGTTSKPEQCGCYFDQGGDSVYFNRRTTDCTQADKGEVGICKGTSDKICECFRSVFDSVSDRPDQLTPTHSADYPVRHERQESQELVSLHRRVR